MDEIPGFWAGAQDCAYGVDLCAAALEAGGWASLEGGGPEALIAAGVPRARAERWSRTPPRRTHGRVLLLKDERYPTRLRECGQAPPVLVIDGDADALLGPAVAVVGTRSCTGYGAQIARHLGTSLGEAGVTVVSGLARGIDTWAHKGALASGRTVAVVGHGLSYTAPPSNEGLRREIVAKGGAIVSGFPDDLPPRPDLFPLRNPWIAGLSDCCVVVEAPERSGALITARAALGQGREVWVVPAALSSPSAKGALGLVGQGGAHVLVDIEAFVTEVGRVERRRADVWLQRLFLGASLEETARTAGFSMAELLAELGRREVRGEVVRLPGQRYAPGGGPG